MTEPLSSDKKWQHFDAAYKKACESSQPQDWLEAALMAQQVRHAEEKAQRPPIAATGETPRTDALNEELCKNASSSGHLLKLLAYARQLERELAQCDAAWREERQKNRELRAQLSATGQTDEKGRPMTYWGGMAQRAEEAATDEDEAEAQRRRDECIGRFGKSSDGSMSKGSK